MIIITLDSLVYCVLPMLVLSLIISELRILSLALWGEGYTSAYNELVIHDGL